MYILCYTHNLSLLSLLRWWSKTNKRKKKTKESSSDWVSCTLHSKFPHRSSCYMCSQISLQSTFYAHIHIHEQIINSCKVQGENKSTSRRKKNPKRKKVVNEGGNVCYDSSLFSLLRFFLLITLHVLEWEQQPFVSRKFELDHNNDRIEQTLSRANRPIWCFFFEELTLFLLFSYIIL